MTSLTQDEYDQLMQLKRLCEYLANNPYPATDIENLKALIRSTLGYEEETETETNEEEQEQESESESRITKSKLFFGNLLGKEAHNNQAIITRKYKGNPYKIPIDIYVKCPACDEIAVSGISIPKRHGITYVYQRFRHEPGSPTHYVRFDRFSGELTWDEILERKKEEGIKAEAV
jgi:hypothetical protein